MMDPIRLRGWLKLSGLAQYFIGEIGLSSGILRVSVRMRAPLPHL